MKKVLSFIMTMVMVCSLLTAFAASTAFAKDNVKVHFNNNASWEKLYIYGWTGEEAAFGAWPGTEVLADSLNDGYFTVDVSCEKMIFNNGAGIQTADLDVGDSEVWVDTAGAMSTIAPDGWKDGSQGGTGEEAKPSNDYYIVGEEGLTGVNWGDGFAEGKCGVKMETDEEDSNLHIAIMENIQPGTYMYKIVRDPANFGWSYCYGDPESSDENANFSIEVPELSAVLIGFDVEDMTIEYYVIPMDEYNDIMSEEPQEEPANVAGEVIEKKEPVETTKVVPEDSTPKAAKEAATVANEDDNSPKTADNSLIFIAAIVAVVSLSGAVVVIKKKARA